MASIFSIQIQYGGNSHYVLISSRMYNGNLQYRITVMNGELEKLIAGHNTIDVVNGKLVLDHCGGNKEVRDLKKQVVNALADYLNNKVPAEPHEQ
jgi:hypothetical protein